MQLIISCFCPWETHRPRHGMTQVPSRWRCPWSVARLVAQMATRGTNHPKFLHHQLLVGSGWWYTYPSEKYESQMRVTNIVSNRTTGALFNGPPSNPPGFWPGAPCNGVPAVGHLQLEMFFLSKMRSSHRRKLGLLTKYGGRLLELDGLYLMVHRKK